MFCCLAEAAAESFLEAVAGTWKNLTRLLSLDRLTIWSLAQEALKDHLEAPQHFWATQQKVDLEEQLQRAETVEPAAEEVPMQMRHLETKLPAGLEVTAAEAALLAIMLQRKAGQVEPMAEAEEVSAAEALPQVESSVGMEPLEHRQAEMARMVLKSMEKRHLFPFGSLCFLP